MSDTDTLEKQEIKPIIDKKDLDNYGINDLDNNPILRPIDSIHETWKMTELTINRALIEYIQEKKEADKLLATNPIYSECKLIAVVKKLIDESEPKDAEIGYLLNDNFNRFLGGE